MPRKDLDTLDDLLDDIDKMKAKIIGIEDVTDSPKDWHDFWYNSKDINDQQNSQ